MQRILIVAFALCAIPTQAQSTAWELDDDSVVRFTCAGEGITNAARGRFSAVNGRLTMDPNNLATARGAIQVLLASVTTELGGWDTMFRAAPFLALADHPRSTFELLEVRGAPRLTEGEWVRLSLSGRLTVKETQRDIVVPARARWTRANGDQRERVEVLATFPLAWTDYDIAMPEGWTRNFAGTHARVRMRLLLER